MCRGRHRQLVGIVLTVILVMLLTACSIGAVGSAPSATATPLPQATATPQPTATVAPTATPFFVNGIAYQRVTDSMFGFSFAVPADAQYLRTNPLPLGIVGDSVTWSDADSNQSNGLDVDFGGATNGYAANQCPQALPRATIVTVGSGLKGYQTNNLVIPPAPQGAAGHPEYRCLTCLEWCRDWYQAPTPRRTATPATHRTLYGASGRRCWRPSSPVPSSTRIHPAAAKSPPIAHEPGTISKSAPSETFRRERSLRSPPRSPIFTLLLTEFSICTILFLEV